MKKNITYWIKRVSWLSKQIRLPPSASTWSGFFDVVYGCFCFFFARLFCVLLAGAPSWLLSNLKWAQSFKKKFFFHFIKRCSVSRHSLERAWGSHRRYVYWKTDHVTNELGRISWQRISWYSQTALMAEVRRRSEYWSSYWRTSRTCFFLFETRWNKMVSLFSNLSTLSRSAHPHPEEQFYRTWSIMQQHPYHR